MYSYEKIEEMNFNVKNNKGLLEGLGIAAFASFAGIGFYFFIFYPTAFQCGNRCCCKNTPMMRVLTFYIVFFSLIPLSFISFIITFSKLIVYKNYSSMEYID